MLEYLAFRTMYTIMVWCNQNCTPQSERHASACPLWSACVDLPPLSTCEAPGVRAKEWEVEQGRGIPSLLCPLCPSFTIINTLGTCLAGPCNIIMRLP